SVPRGYSYSPGSFSKLISKDFVNAFKVNAKYVQDNQKDFKANWDRIGKNYKVDQDRMEEAAKEKAKKGLIWDALEVCAGVVLVATGVGSEFGVMLIVGGVNGAINHASIATTGNSFNILGSLTNGAEQWYNKNIGEPLVKTGNPALQFAAGCGDAAIQFVGAKYQLDVYDIGDTVHTLWTNPEAQAQFKAGVGNYWNKLSSGNAYTIGQTTGTVLSFVVNPGDIGAAAGKASKAESLLGKVGTFSKSIAVSSVENAKNIATSPWRTVDNLGSKVADLRTVFSEGKGAIGDLTNSVVVSSAKNAENIINLTGRTLGNLRSKFADLSTALSQGNGIRYAFQVAGDDGSIFSKISKQNIEHVDADKICQDRYAQWIKGKMSEVETEVETIPPEKLLGIEHDPIPHPRSALNEKIPRSKGAHTNRPGHRLTKEEKRLANQHLNDLIARRNGDSAAANRLSKYREHPLFDKRTTGGDNFAGWTSLDLSATNNSSNIMRLLYKEDENVIEWKIIQQH
ncbi:hypothetical protein, partial [Clostridium acetobutylicum]